MSNRIRLSLVGLALAFSLTAHAQTSGAAFNLLPCAGNSAIDDTPALWNALSLPSSNVYFLSPANICYVNFVGPYTLPAGIKLVGTPGRTILRPFSPSKNLAVLSNSDISFEGITFDSHVPVLSGTQNALLFVEKSQRIVLLNNVFMSSAPGGTSTGNAVYFWNASGRIQNNEFSSFQSQIIVKADAGINPVVTIAGNHLHDNSSSGGNAIAISNDGGATKVDLAVDVEGNQIQNINASSSSTGQNGNAIDIYLANHVRVSNNHIDTVRFSCFRSASSDDSVFTANACLNAGESAAYSEFTSQHNQWVDNYFVSAQSNCLNLTNLNVGGELHTAIGNHMIKCGGSGIHAEGNAVVTGNTIDQSENGILVGFGSYGMNVLVKDNLITDTSGSNVTKFGIGVEDGATTGVEVEGNRIDLGANLIIGTTLGVPSGLNCMPVALTIRNQALLFAMLGSPADGSFVYCPDCSAAAVCRPVGTGAFARRLHGSWICQ